MTAWRTLLSLAALFLVGMVVPAGASELEFKPSAPRQGDLRFKLGKLDPSQIRSGYLRVGSQRQWLSASRLRAASGKRLRLRLRPTLAQRRLACGSTRRAACARLYRRARLVVRLGSTQASCSDSAPYRAGRWPDGCWRPYADDSPFNRVIPDRPPLMPNSQQIIQRVSAWGRPQNLSSSGEWGHPLYWASPSDPLYTVRCAEDWGKCEIEGHQIRIPSQARSAAPEWPRGDGHMAVVQPDGWEYDFWQVRHKPSGGGEIVISWGGRTRIDGDGLGSNATAGLFGTAAGIIRAAELERGEIRHALFLVLKCDAGSSVYPAVNHSGRACTALGESNHNAAPMGARLQLTLSRAEIEALPVPRWRKTVYHAMARYGMIVGDTGGEGMGIQVESERSYTSFGLDNPLVGFAQANGWDAYSVPSTNQQVWVGKFKDDPIDWAKRLRVVDPCVSRGDC